MAKPIHFVPSRARSANENFWSFVSYVKDDLRGFFEVNWDDVSWDMSRYFSNRAHPNSEVRLAWRGIDEHGARFGPPLLPKVSSFAKAFISYSHVMRPTQNVPRKRLDPFKAIDLAMRRHGIEADYPWDAVLFNQAEEVIREKWNAATAYRAGKELEKIAAFLDENFMTPTRMNWHSTLVRPCDQSWRICEKATEIRQSKMPSDEALFACAEVFNLAVRLPDVLLSSVVPLLMAGPNRIGEVLSLPVNAVVEEIFDGRAQFGLRWFSEKDGPHQVKWVLPSFVSTVRRAFDNIVRITTEARAMAKWYSENKSIYLPKGLEYLRNQSYLSGEELCLLLGLQGKADNSARQWCARRKIDYSNRPFRVWLRDVELHVLDQLPSGFPWRHRPTRLQYKDSLFVVPKYFFHNGNRPMSNVMFEPVNHSHINMALGEHERHGKSSIFGRFGLVEKDGAPISITTHAFRHWLNTIAQRGGLSQLEIALWSGRKSVHQNSAYDHMTADELLSKVEQMVPANGAVGTLKTSVLSKNEIASIISSNSAGAIHHTEIGICVHDYTMLPCQLHMDCINCHESICIKGDAEKNRRIVEFRDRVQASLKQAQIGNEAGNYGADRWSKHQQLTLERLQKLVNILNDPNVPEGTVIQLTPDKEWTPIKQACEERMLSDPLVQRLFADDKPQISSNRQG